MPGTRMTRQALRVPGSRPRACRIGLPKTMDDGQANADPPDEVLLANIAAGDAAAFAVFYDRHETLWYSLALRMLRDEAEAEDVVQDAAVLIWERAPQYDASLGRPLSWAVTVVRNRAIDRLRANRRRWQLIEAAIADRETTPGIGGESAESGCQHEARLVLQRALEGLPGEQRKAIELAFFAGLSQSEVSERLRQPLGTIKARIRRGMLAMRDALEGAL